MKAGEVPQATIERVIAVVRAVAAGAVDRKEVAEAIGVTSRHASYGVAAARALQLVAPQDPLEVTPLGKDLSSASAGSAAESGVLRQAIDASPALRAMAPGLLNPEPPPVADIAAKLMRAGGLGRETAHHRAMMILAWRRRLGLHRALRTAGASRGWWRRIELRNFRSIESVTVDLAPLTLVVGPNGSGKSNFADALVFARDVALDASAAMESRGGILGVRRWRPTKPTDVTVDVRAARSRRDLDTNYVRHSFTIHSGKKGDWSFSRETLENVIKQDLAFHIERSRDSYAGETLNKVPIMPTASAMVTAHQLRKFARSAALRSVRRYRVSPDEMRKPQLSSDKTRLDENGANIAVAVRNLRESKNADLDALLRTMGRIVPGLEDIYPEQVGRYITLKFKQRQARGEIAEFNATEMSEGALRALGIVVASLQMHDNELLIVEEPEVSLHVGAANLLFDVLKQASMRGSVLVTTHSADLLDAAKQENILVCEYRDGITHVGPLSTEQKTMVREGLYSLAELVRVEPLRIEGTRPREFSDDDGLENSAE